MNKLESKMINISNPCSKFIVGSAQFGMEYGVTNNSGIISNNEAQNIVETCLKSGIRLFDTAKSYGTSEVTLGKFSSEDIDFITKISGHNYIGQVLDSVKKLNKKCLHGVLMHDEKEVNLFKKQKELLSLKNKSLTQSVGISVYDYELLKSLLNTSFVDEIDIIQVPLNILSMNEYKKDILNELKQRNIEIHVRSVFLQGILLLENYDELPSYFDKYKNVLLKWDSLVKRENLKKLDVCLSGILNLECVDKVILGVENCQQLIDLISFEYLNEIPKINYNKLNENLTNPTKWSI